MRAKIIQNAIIQNENPNKTKYIPANTIVEVVDKFNDDLCVVRYNQFNKIIEQKYLMVIEA